MVLVAGRLVRALTSASEMPRAGRLRHCSRQLSHTKGPSYQYNWKGSIHTTYTSKWSSLSSDQAVNLKCFLLIFFPKTWQSSLPKIFSPVYTARGGTEPSTLPSVDSAVRNATLSCADAISSRGKHELRWQCYGKAALSSQARPWIHTHKRVFLHVFDAAYITTSAAVGPTIYWRLTVTLVIEMT